jgi:hypothetical protein
MDCTARFSGEGAPGAPGRRPHPAASDARIPGLDQAEAGKLRDQLATLGEAQAAGL